MLEQDNNQTKQKIVTVGDSSSRELNYLYKTIIDGTVYDGGPYLAWACCDNTFNQEDTDEGQKRCKYCKKISFCVDERERDEIDHVFSTAALWGLFASTGTLVGSQLSTTCPRLQKHGDSLASLSYGSHLDMIHPSFNPEAVVRIEEAKTVEEGTTSKMRRSMAEKFKSLTKNEDKTGKLAAHDDGEDHYQESDDEDDHMFHPSIGDYCISDINVDENNKVDVHPLVQAYAAGDFVSSLSLLSLSGGSIHAKGMKYKSDNNLKNTKGEISVLSERVVCKCEEQARLFLYGDDDEEKSQRRGDTIGNDIEASEVAKD